MNKHTAIFAGHTFTRNSKTKTYSHVVLVTRPDGSVQQSSVTWSGRPDLAKKVYADAVRSVNRTVNRNGEGWKVHIVEATIIA